MSEIKTRIVEIKSALACPYHTHDYTCRHAGDVFDCYEPDWAFPANCPLATIEPVCSNTINKDYKSAINDLHRLHSDISLADLPYGKSWLDRIEKIISYLKG